MSTLEMEGLDLEEFMGYLNGEYADVKEIDLQELEEFQNLAFKMAVNLSYLATRTNDEVNAKLSKGEGRYSVYELYDETRERMRLAEEAFGKIWDVIDMMLHLDGAMEMPETQMAIGALFSAGGQAMRARDKITECWYKVTAKM